MTVTNTSKAIEAAKAEGLSFFWASMHVGGSTQFVGQSWEDGGFRVDADGNPAKDSRGNTVASCRAEAIDPENAQHVAQVEEWYG